MRGLFPLVITPAIAQVKHFYKELFDFEVLIDIGWYIQLQHRDVNALQIALIAADHDSVPSQYQATPAGVVITLECANAAYYCDRATNRVVPVHIALRDEEWGQRHFIAEDPTGLLVDVVQPIAPTQEFLERHGLAEAAS